MADKNIYWSKTALTGGEAGALDSIDGTALQDGEVAHVWVSGVLYVYLLDVDSAAAESSPTVISPDANAGDKRWILQGVSAGGGLAFPATQKPSAGANTLDDYEEGTWNPALKFGGNAVDIKYDTQSGYYTKIGRVVNYAVHLDLSSKGSSTGAATIDLPFNNAPTWFAGSVGYVSAVTYANQIMSRVNGNVINLYEVTEAGAVTTITNADFDNASVISVAGMYMST